MNRNICLAAFAVGLAVVGWVGAGYAGNSPLALAMTLVIAAVYGTGAVEMLRFHQATATLARALAAIPDNLAHLDEWLGAVHPSLQNPVRLRVEGERIGLPGPAVTPYLVGLLVLLGMLGTFLGMVVTLNGAVLALEHTTDLHTIRGALAAPIKGLGFAFGTSVAGVAASAMLGLISALCRRERLRAGQTLDSRIATDLREFSLAHQRQETYRVLQRQAQALPAVVDQLEALMARLDRQQQQVNERLLAGQEGFYQSAGRAYADLAAAVDQSLKSSLTESARLAGATIEPVVAATMAGMARETAALQQGVAATVQARLDGLAERFGHAVGTAADGWAAAQARQVQASDAVHQQLLATLGTYAKTFTQDSATLLASVQATHAGLQADLATTTRSLAEATAALHGKLVATVETQLDGLARRVDTAVAGVDAHWNTALARQEQVHADLAAGLGAAHGAFAETFAQRSAALLASIQDAHATLRSDLAAGERAGRDAQAAALAALARSLGQEWQAAGAATLAQQERICQTLAATAGELTASTKAQVAHTIDEVTRLMHTAAEAPRAAAAVIGQLRQELSASMARDNALLEERSRILDTLGSLLEAIDHAATGQRTAIDTLVSSSAALLDRVGSQFAARLDRETTRLEGVAAQVASGAVEVASLGEAFGAAVQHFGASSDTLTGALQRIEGALGKSLARSDDQLAYYVAQARELIDLSILSQKQIVDDLQRIAGQPALAAEA